jgi:hypothetical protein
MDYELLFIIYVIGSLPILIHKIVGDFKILTKEFKEIMKEKQQNEPKGFWRGLK